MRKTLILTFIAMLTLSLASCDLDPTGTGVGHDRDDKHDDRKDKEVIHLRGMEGDSFKTPCDFYFTIESINVSESNSDVATDRKDQRHIAITIVVTKADGSVETHTLTKENPSVTIGDCIIHLKDVGSMKSRDSDSVQHVATFAITTGK